MYDTSGSLAGYKDLGHDAESGTGFEKVEIGNATLYCGDCYEILPHIQADALVSDPPYGVPIMTNFNLGKKGNRAAHGKEFAPVKGNDEPFDPTPFLNYPLVLMWGANHFAHRLPDNGRWLVWDKRCGVTPQRTQADGELAWVNEYGAARIFRHVWDGMIKDSEKGEEREHPTQKPVQLMKWCLQFAPEAKVIFDPFMGSGTTGVAAVEEGRTFIGIEYSSKYFAVAKRRIERAQQQGKLF